ncbi:hypothetical protein BCY86_02915 [Pajaroellobacter abortibovis]|uniref:Uncharacterized protein n=1 Tax=Pajaroellobacter abortibovis TaxID=1882918 RepID=A0A1L6MW51_9BACT|nr:hypothetical protein BCY86_02915 [Pajaroellobacter abortibovis]
MASVRESRLEPQEKFNWEKINRIEISRLLYEKAQVLLIEDEALFSEESVKWFTNLVNRILEQRHTHEILSGNPF